MSPQGATGARLSSPETSNIAGLKSLAGLERCAKNLNHLTLSEIRDFNALDDERCFKYFVKRYSEVGHAVEILFPTTDINQMEYVIPPVILLLLVRYGLPAPIMWFFETVVKPRAAAAKKEETSQAVPRQEPSNAQKIGATRAGLDQLKARLPDE